MDIQDTTILAWVQAVGLVLASAAALLWSKYFRAAKKAEIDAKDAEIASKQAELQVLERQMEQLESLNPVTLREYFKANMLTWEEYANDLQAEVEESRTEAEQKQEEVVTLRRELDDLRQGLRSSQKVEMARLREEMGQKQQVLDSREADLRRLRERNQLLEEHMQEVRGSGGRSGLFGTAVEFDRLYREFLEAAQAEDFESMEATHALYREGLQRLDSLRVYAAKLDAAITDFTPRYRDFTDRYHARLREGLSTGERAGYEGTRFSMIRKLMWAHYGAKRELGPSDLVGDAAE